MPENPTRETAVTANTGATMPGNPSLAGRILDGEECRAVIAHALDAIFVVDADGRLADVNPAACELVGGSRESLLGAAVERYFVPVPIPGLSNAADGGWSRYFNDGFHTVECVVHCADGSRRYADVRARANFLPGLHLCVARDSTEHRLAVEAIQHADQLCRSLIENTGTGYVIIDPRGGVVDANAEYVRLSGHESLDDIRGRHPREWTAASDRGRLMTDFDACWKDGSVQNLEVDFVNAPDHRVPVEINASILGAGDDARMVSLCRDITGRLQTQQELHAARVDLENVVQNRTAELDAATAQLRSRARQQESVAELGRLALAGASIDEVMNAAVRTVAAVLGLEFCAILEHADPECDDLVLRATFGWSADAVGRVVATTDPEFATGFALHAGVPVWFEDIEAETRFRPPPGMREAGVVSGVSVGIGDEHTRFGLLAARGKQRRRFTPDDTHFLQSVANVLATAIARRRAEETVRQAQLGAVQANNAKIDFLSRMSHELRTPLNAILGFSQLLEIERLNDGQRESVEQITRAGRHLLELVNEVLDISRIDSGNIALVPEPLAVDELWDEAVDLIRPLADARAIRIVCESAGSGGGGRYVLADRQRLRQVLLNLLSNAVKYNAFAGTVTLRRGIAPDARHVRLSVTDTGAGIAAESLPLLFTPFERLGAENTDVEGSGMGLALSKRLVEAQGGEMGVESSSAAGSTFWIDLPVAAPPLDDGNTPLLLDELIHTRLFDEDEAEPPTLPASSNATALKPLPAPGLPVRPANASRQRVVLHIEDNEPNQRLIEMLLSQRPTLRLLTASRGGEGFALAQKYHPDLILLDVHLPDTSGENVLHDLRADAGTRDVPVVIVSADAASIRHSQLHGNGANNYLLKPFNVTQFLKILDEYILKSAA